MKAKMEAIVVKCTRKLTEDSVNGPLTRVTLTPGGPLNTGEGSITIFVHGEEDLKRYEVGRFFRLVPEPAP